MVYNYNAKILIIFSTPTYTPTFLYFILSYFLHRFYLSSVFQMITYLQKKIRQRKNTIRSVVSTTKKLRNRNLSYFGVFLCKSINGSAKSTPSVSTLPAAGPRSGRLFILTNASVAPVAPAAPVLFQPAKSYRFRKTTPCRCAVSPRRNVSVPPGSQTDERKAAQRKFLVGKF